MTCIEDTETVDLEIDVATGLLSATVKISADANNLIVAHADGIYADSAAAQMPPGVIWEYGGLVAPEGWLLCDGSEYDRVEYSALFDIIGTSYGPGNGSTFNVPDFCGRGSVGISPAGHADVNALGKNEGPVPLASRTPRHNSMWALNGVLPNHVHSAGSYVGSIDDPAERNGTGETGPGAANSARLQYRSVTISGNSGNPTSLPSIAISGTVGPGGSRPSDTAAFLVVTKIIKT